MHLHVWAHIQLWLLREVLLELLLVLLLLLVLPLLLLLLLHLHLHHRSSIRQWHLCPCLLCLRLWLRKHVRRLQLQLWRNLQGVTTLHRLGSSLHGARHLWHIQGA
jgi:hypothetical protein